MTAFKGTSFLDSFWLVLLIQLAVQGETVGWVSPELECYSRLLFLGNLMFGPLSSFYALPRVFEPIRVLWTF